MADTILSGRWVVYYEAENRQKRIWRDTSVSATTTDTVNALYSALQNHFDELSQMDDGVPMSAQTPTEYTIGIIDAGDKDPWFVDRTSVEYLTGGALKTTSWQRSPLTGDGTGTVGIIRLAYTVGGTDFDVTDIGRDIKDTTDNDLGTLLDFNTVSSTKYLWIRPDSNAAANSFDSAATHTLAIQTDSISQVWRVVASGTVYEADETVDANSAGANDWQIFPTGAAADYATIGYSQKFKKLTVNVGTAGTGTYTVPAANWQYWNGAWTSLSGVTDGTTGFKTSGTNSVTFTVPTDWVATSLNGSQNLYYIRALKDTGTVTQTPLGTQGWIGGTGSVTQTAAAAVSGGESLWANIYSIGTLEDYTHLYIYQNTGNLLAYKGTTDWWGDKTTGQVIPGTSTLTDHIDILVNVKELGTETDEAVIKVFARQYSKTYSYYTVDLTTGGRNPIPLQTGNDLDNQTGYRTFTVSDSSGSGTFTVGNYFYFGGTWATATKRAKITAVGGTSANPVLTYYLLGDPITDFSAGNQVQEYTGTADGDGECLATAPSDTGPAALGTPPTVLFGTRSTGGTEDIDENGTAENYSIAIDCNQNTLADVYEWTKYVTRRGSTADLDTGAQTIEGQFYLGTDYRIVYTTLGGTGTIDDGETVTGASSGATGIVVNHNTTDKIIMLRNSRGTFTQGEQINQGTTNVTTTTITAVTPITAAPFGTFAGGTFFVAQGIVLTDYITSQANNFQLKTDEGTVTVAPTKVTISVGNTRATDKVGVFRLTAASGSIVKNRYYATAQSALATSAIITSGGQSGSATITADEPGRTAGGVVRLVDTSASTEYRIRFTSWTSSTFTLSYTNVASALSGTNTTNVKDTGLGTASKVGDLLVNVTRSNAVSYVTAIVDADNVTISPAITGQTTADNVKFNVLPVATTTSPQDTWYVPMIDVYETTGTSGTPGTETAEVTYLGSSPAGDIPVRVRARNAGTIIPYEADSTVTVTGLSNSIIRTTDTIFT